MRIGTVKEILPGENRVALTPSGVADLVRDGHEVMVEEGAGAGSSHRDEDYKAAGAVPVSSAESVWEAADLVVKVKQPLPAEYGFLQPGRLLFTYLHLAAEPPLAQALVASGVTAIAYETVESDDGRLPLLAPMSEVAGRLAPQVGAMALMHSFSGRGVLPGGVPGVAPARVVVIGGGVVGSNAALIAVGMLADVVLFDTAIDRLRQLEGIFGGRVRLLASSESAVEEAVLGADMVIGAVLLPGAKAPRLVSRDMLPRMKPGAVLVDVSIDQGGCFETSRPTTHESPTYVTDQIVHYCVANMPGAVPTTATQALTNVTLPYIRQLCRLGLDEAIRSHPDLRAGVNVLGGRVVHPTVAASLGLPWTPPDEAR